MTAATRIAARLNGAEDLYAALRNAATAADGAVAVRDIIAACDAATAARLAAVDAGLPIDKAAAQNTQLMQPQANAEGA